MIMTNYMIAHEIHNVPPESGLPTLQPDLGHPTLHKQLCLQCNRSSLHVAVDQLDLAVRNCF